MLSKLFAIKQSNGGWQQLIVFFKSPFPRINQRDRHCSSRNLYLCFEPNSTWSVKQAMGDFRQRRIQTLKRVVKYRSLRHHHHHPLAKGLVKPRDSAAVTSLLPQRTHSHKGRHVLSHTKGLRSVGNYKGNSNTKVKQEEPRDRLLQMSVHHEPDLWKAVPQMTPPTSLSFPERHSYLWDVFLYFLL